ncbi:MAG TPA: hypothetical protein PKH78_00420, partial [Candidatus Obscuribacter sp.]|nr:hypothetical protein [Candidatus Obscuribacter sp.]
MVENEFSQGKPENEVGKEGSSVLEMRHSEDSHVRRIVAGNPNTPLAVLTRLADDLSYHVRRAVAENPRSGDALLMYLAS